MWRPLHFNYEHRRFLCYTASYTLTLNFSCLYVVHIFVPNTKSGFHFCVNYLETVFFPPNTYKHKPTFLCQMYHNINIAYTQGIYRYWDSNNSLKLTVKLTPATKANDAPLLYPETTARNPTDGLL